MNNNKIHLVAADMGYGHQRAAYPLVELSREGIVNLNDYEGIEKWEKQYWLKTQKSYDKISSFKHIPILGNLVFKTMDFFQRIEPFYPRRDLSPQTFQQKIFFKVIKKGLGQKLIDNLNKEPLPLVTTFFVAAYCAEYYKYQGPIYCLVCDTDVSRAWAPLNPQTSKIIYLAPNQRVRQRLLMYGVSPANIKITGFPLPAENIENNFLEKDLAIRLNCLDPLKKFQEVYHQFLPDKLSPPAMSNRLFTVTFAVGGAGAQKEIGGLIFKKLLPLIKENKLFLNLIAGNRAEVNDYFQRLIRSSQMENNQNIQVIYHPQKMEYFRLFNLCLRNTDVLWTKPSELSFYAGLGLPIIISDPVGSQEVCNRDWLLSIGAGLDSLDPEFVDEWLPDWRRDGRLARAALNAYLNASHNGLVNIKKEIFPNF